jgi:hypothetical protein
MLKQITVLTIKKKIINILRKHGVVRASLFGSVARGDATKDSDIDILIELKDDIDLLEFIGIKQELETVLGRKVDLVEYDCIKPQLRENILSEQVVIV